MSVDTRTKGRRLDGYTRRSVDGHELLLDPDLLRLPIGLTITTGGLLGRPASAPPPTASTAPPARSSCSETDWRLG